MAPLDKKDLLAMKLLHYFITEKNYNPMIVHGVTNEIWLENLDSEYKIVRIVLNYIHNEEQFNFDTYKVKHLINQIRLKTFTLSLKVVSFYLDINNDVKVSSSKNHFAVIAKTQKNIEKNDFVNKVFPDINEKLIFTEEGSRLYEKINGDILTKNAVKANQINEVFAPKKPLITRSLIVVLTLMMILMHVLGNGSMDISTLFNFGALVKNGDLFRVFTSMFLHIGIIHYLSNVYALEIIGKQVETFFGHLKTLVIFIYSGIIGNLVSLLLMSNNTISAGASGAIFGLMGALLYFSFNQRTYMLIALKNQILPVIILNLMISFMVPSINLFAHIGGLLGGVIIASALGIKYKTSKFEKINGFIASTILLVLLVFFGYFY